MRPSREGYEHSESRHALFVPVLGAGFVLGPIRIMVHVPCGMPLRHQDEKQLSNRRHIYQE